MCYSSNLYGLYNQLLILDVIADVAEESSLPKPKTEKKAIHKRSVSLQWWINFLDFVPQGHKSI